MVDKIISNGFEMISRYSEPYIHVYNSQGWLERYEVEKNPSIFTGSFIWELRLPKVLFDETIRPQCRRTDFEFETWFISMKATRGISRGLLVYRRCIMKSFIC